MFIISTLLIKLIFFLSVIKFLLSNKLSENKIPPMNDGIALYNLTDTRKEFYARSDKNFLNFFIFLEIVLCETPSFRAISL